MTITVAHLWRHPIKSHGRESLDTVTLTAGQTMPWDRTWAIAHEGAQTDGSEWAPCANFSRVAKAPPLMAIATTLDEAREELTLNHPDRDPITLHPEQHSDRLLAWLQPLMPTDRARSTRIVRVPGRGMTDTPFPSVSIAGLLSHRQVEQSARQSLSPHRGRANIWLDGTRPWEEFEWVGNVIRLGTSEIEIKNRAPRCLATTANPDTGERDADTLAALKRFGHQEFAIYGVVHKSGTIALGDTVEPV